MRWQIFYNIQYTHKCNISYNSKQLIELKLLCVTHIYIYILKTNQNKKNQNINPTKFALRNALKKKN